MIGILITTIGISLLTQKNERLQEYLGELEAG